LPAELDWSSLQINGSSHALTSVSIDQNGLASFVFENIILPDSSADQMGSHGYVSFSIAQNSDVQFYDPILNEANIYFDFNEPVLTNTSHNEVFDCSSLGTLNPTFGGDCSAAATEFTVDGVWISSYLWQDAVGNTSPDSVLSILNTTSSQLITLQIDNELCPAQILTGVTEVLPDLSIAFQSISLLSNAENVSYQWYWESLPIAGETNNQLNGWDEGLYYVVLTTTYGCSYNSDSLLISNVNELDKSFILNLYPVPAQNELIVNCNLSQNTTLTITSSTGAIVLQEKAIGTQFRLDLTTLESGLYTLHCNGQHRNFVVVKD
jgi:hypothetical protein